MGWTDTHGGWLSRRVPPRLIPARVSFLLVGSAAKRSLAAWFVLVAPFVVLAAFRWTRGELGAGFVAAYWLHVLSLPVAGVLPAPWQPAPD